VSKSFKVTLAVIVGLPILAVAVILVIPWKKTDDGPPYIPVLAICDSAPVAWEAANSLDVSPAETLAAARVAMDDARAVVDQAPEGDTGRLTLESKAYVDSVFGANSIGRPELLKPIVDDCSAAEALT
jgi:hypothetical protein